jgi:formylglycine-generating enzyme required for sulfatase activity
MVPATQGKGCRHPEMTRVQGRMLVGSLELLQDATCTRWISREFPARCAVFDEAKWKRARERLPTKPLSFCIDRFEFPNVAGENPVVVVTYHEAKKACADLGKRLCTDEEWTFACEGEEGLPYPYGYERDPAKCGTDRAWRQYDAHKLSKRDSAACGEELEKLWQGKPSGAMPDCRSPFGVYDLTGNIDEWTENRISGGKYKGAQKGGYWGPVRARCRPATIAHDEGHTFYQQGFRCCADE